MSRIQIRESVDFHGRVDEVNKVIRDVAVLGAVSRNGYKYRPEALRSAARQFEGCRVYVDHAGRNGKVRSVRDYVGRLEGLRVDGPHVRAARFVVANEGYWPLVASVARDTTAFGLSIDAEALTAPGGDVLEIVKANSVDLVANPATTTGVFEDEHERRDTPRKGATMSEDESLQEAFGGLADPFARPESQSEREFRRLGEALGHDIDPADVPSDEETSLIESFA